MTIRWQSLSGKSEIAYGGCNEPPELLREEKKTTTEPLQQLESSVLRTDDKNVIKEIFSLK